VIVAASAVPLPERQKLNLIDPVPRKAARSHEHQIIEHVADGQALVHGDYARHVGAASDALQCVPSHCRHVMREKNAIFLRCPHEDFWVGAPAVTSFTHAQYVHVRERPP
jgi:hypothetical protein